MQAASAHVARQRKRDVSLIVSIWSSTLTDSGIKGLGSLVPATRLFQGCQNVR